MASCAVKQGGGYSYAFVTNPPESLLCCLCRLVARDPHLSVCCGTNFCKQCLKKRTNQESGCPVCKDIDVLTTFPNKMSDREIKKLVVLCVNNGQGCEWKDELTKLEDHVSTCEMQDVECSSKCGAMLKRMKLHNHLVNECPCRQAICEYCCMTGEHHVIMGEHRDQCPKLPLSCPNGCGLTDIIKSQIDEHLKKCPLQKTICKYDNIGCKAMLASQEQDEHDEACMKEHFQLMSNELVFAKGELADAKLRVSKAEDITKQVKNELALTKEELTDTKQKASKAEQSLEKVTDELTCTKEELVIAKVKIGKMEQSTERMQKEFETRLLKIQEEFFQWKEVSCSVFCGMLPSFDWQTKLTVSSMLVEQSNVVTPVIIRITDVSEKIRNNDIFQSPPFYTHCFGYRVCLIVALSGTDESKGSAVSVGISSLHGPNDSKLSWPLREQFTVTLLNQVKNNNHRFLTLGVVEPIKASTETARCVCKEFINHGDLFTVSSACKYQADGIVYMQVQYLYKN